MASNEPFFPDPQQALELWNSRDKMEKVLLINLTVQLVMTLFGLIALLLDFIFDTKLNADLLLLKIIMLASFACFLVAQYYFAYSALTAVNCYELLSFMTMSSLSWIGIIGEAVNQLTDENGKYKTVYGISIIIFIGVLSVNQFFYFWAGASVYKILAWKTYKKLGANAQLQSAYKNLQLNLSLIRLIGTLYVSQFVSMLYVDIKAKKGGWSIALNVFILLVASSFVSLGYFGVREGRKRNILMFVISVMLYAWLRIKRSIDFVQTYVFKTGGSSTTGKEISMEVTGFAIIAGSIEIISFVIFILLIIFGYQHYKIIDTDLFGLILKAESENMDQSKKPNAEFSGGPQVTIELQKKETIFIPDDSIITESQESTDR